MEKFRRVWKGQAVHWFRGIRFPPYRGLADFVLRNRRLLFGCFAAAALLLYIRIYMLSPKKSDLEDGPCFSVFGHQMQAYHKEIDSHDAAVVYFPFKGIYKHSEVLPFVGNGLVGVALSESSRLLVRGAGQPSFTSTSINMVHDIELTHPHASVLGALISRFRNGIVEKQLCFGFNDHCIRVHSVFYASRLSPYLFIQEISFHNPTKDSVTFTLRRDDTYLNTGFVKSKIGDELKCPLGGCYGHQGVVKSSNLGLTLILPEQSGIVKVDSKSSSHLRLISVVIPHNDTVTPSDEQFRLKVLLNGKDAMSKALNRADGELLNEHIKIWQETWNSGFSIAQSQAPDSLNGDVINATMYYVLSNYAYEVNGLKSSRDHSNQQQCYSSHSTLLSPSKLWAPLSRVESILAMLRGWHFTLVEHGCESLVSKGARGVLQAMILSFGAFKRRMHHLQFDQQPNELHRDSHFRNVHFDGNVFVNIWVVINSDNKAVLYVSVNSTDSSGSTLFACDAGCLDPPIQLTSKQRLIPMKQTAPPTPILYISDDKGHLDRLKMSIHVKEVVDAPAHENHVIAMHKHGHRLGGLPTIFWFTLGFLLLVFHLFLLKLIYNEYKGNRKTLPAYRYSA